MPKRPCLICGIPTHGSHCEEHKPAPYDYAWQQLVAQMISEQPWCSYCEQAGTPDNPLTGDHRIPRALGGQNVRANVRIACRRCNSRKSAGPGG